MSFVRTNIGLVNLAYVVSIEENHEGKALLTLSDGRYAVSDLISEAVTDRIGNVIPNCTPVLGLSIDDDGDEVWTQAWPIVGWSISENRVTAVTAAGDAVRYLLYPDGRVDEPGGSLYASIEHAVEEYKKNR